MDVWTRLADLPPVAAPEGTRAAVLVPLYEDDQGEVRLILTKRPEGMRTHPGDVVFPGGTLEPGEGPVEAALREAEEEIGLARSAVVRIFGALGPRYVAGRRDQPIVPVVARVERPAELVPDPAEVAVIIEPTLGELADESRWWTEDWRGHELWFFRFPEGLLWGATARMVRELLERIGGSP